MATGTCRHGKYQVTEKETNFYFNNACDYCDKSMKAIEVCGEYWLCPDCLRRQEVYEKDFFCWFCKEHVFSCKSIFPPSKDRFNPKLFVCDACADDSKRAIEKYKERIRNKIIQKHIAGCLPGCLQCNCAVKNGETFCSLCAMKG